MSAIHATSNSLTFGIIGDFGYGNAASEQAAKSLHAQKPTFIISVGDNNYPDGCRNTFDKHVGKLYSKYIGNYQGQYGNGSPVNLFCPTLGNHDWQAQTKYPINQT